MTNELISGHPAATEREQVGRFLRHAFPLGLDSFAGLVSKNPEWKAEHEQLRGDFSAEEALLALIH
jgi:hypothetical protein